MALPSPGVPHRFPCWCRAIYSWGGETKKDLGFVEGDLIECLNAGIDGWWMGRLRRDKRAMGLFPSNFVKVLDEGFVPVSRAPSPMPGGPASRTVSPSPQKKTAFRKPFQAYSAPTAREVEVELDAPSPSPSRQPSYLQNSSQESSRYNSYSSRHHSRAPSPAPPRHQQLSRGPSPNPYQDVGSSPPPVPPPHRIAYNGARARATPSPVPSMGDRYPMMSRGHTPVPHSPIPGHTPSPLRDAMDDVMSSLQDMALRRDSPSPSLESPTQTLDPWSPEAFGEVRSNSRNRRMDRPQSSMALSLSRNEECQVSGAQRSYAHSSANGYQDPPQLSDYVERMEHRLSGADQLGLGDMGPPPVPIKNSPYQPRAYSSMDTRDDEAPKLRNRKSAYELGRQMVNRTFTTKSTATNASSVTQSSNSTTSTQATSQSLMSGYSASGISATSAGSLARKRGGWGSISGRRPNSVAESRHGHSSRPQTPQTGYSYHSSHASMPAWTDSVVDSGTPLGGLAPTPQLKPRKSGFLRKLVESAKTGTASVRSSIAGGQEVPRSPVRALLPNGIASISGGSSPTKDRSAISNGGTVEWMHVRRDVNRSNSLSQHEKNERADRCQIMDYPVIAPVDALAEVAEGDEGLDGMPISEPTDFQKSNLQLVDKSARFVTSLPHMTNPTSLAQAYVCRPYRNDVQRFRAIFTWVSEKIVWEEDFEGEPDPRRVIQTRRGCSEEIAVLVFEMCRAMGLGVEVVNGYLKGPEHVPDLNSMPRPNHWWNAVLIDGEWRIMDCSLASPSHPRRHHYSSVSSQIAESWYFLTRPLEICYTHIPSLLEQQHIVPPIAPDILLALPCSVPPFFKNSLRMVDYDTSLFRLEGLELMHIHVAVPSDVELFAEVTVTAYARDIDGDRFESGDTITKRALAQAEWIAGEKRFTIKALLPSDESHGVLRVYAGKRGLMHSITDNPYPLALALPVLHQGANPLYEFLTRHPTPHAQRHDLYVSQPQCKTLACNNTFVFAVRQHPSSLSASPSSSSTTSSILGRVPSPLPFIRPASAMSMASSSASGSGTGSLPSSQAAGTQQAYKPAKLAVQAPSGKILRLTRKSSEGEIEGGGGTWEAFIKVGERGVWRGLVLADRSARWCVFGEWDCV